MLRIELNHMNTLLMGAEVINCSKSNKQEVSIGAILDAVLKEQLIEGPETINATYVSEAIDIENREMEFSIQAVYENGVATDMIWALEVSNNGTSWSEVTDSQQAFSDPSGSIIYDLAGMGPTFVRLKVIVTAGTIDLTEILYIGRRRH